MNRPTGVTIIAILYFLNAAVTILAGLALLGIGSVAGLAAGGGKAGAPEGAAAIGFLVGLGVVGAVICFIFAALPLATGIGLWKLKNWGRVIAIVLGVIWACFQALGLLGSLMHFEIFSMMVGLIMLGLNVWIILYLMKPHVKAAFGAA
jgi:hypothetical protein